MSIPESAIEDNIATTPLALPTTAPNFSELGRTGLSRWGGLVSEDYITELRWPRAAKIYKEMSLSDPVVGAILFIGDQLIRQAPWTVEACGDSDEDKKAAAFVEECLNDMSISWVDTVSEILSFRVYGWSLHEIVYKLRKGYNKNPDKSSQYDDGKVGWAKLPSRSQATLDHWIFGSGDQVTHMAQQTEDGFYAEIPLSKALLFRTTAERGNPEGRSLLRNAYRPWYFKKRIEEFEAIGIERDLAGLPMLEPPPGVDLWNAKDENARALKSSAEILIRNVRRDQNEGVIIPPGWKFTLLSTGGRRSFDTNAIINRYDQRIAITFLADIVMMGGDKVGSFALAEVKKSLMGLALEAMLQSIAEVFNRYAVPRLFAVNPSFTQLTKYPKLVPGEVETPSVTELARLITALAGAGAPLFPDDNLEDTLRQIASLPKRSIPSDQMPEPAVPARGQLMPGQPGLPGQPGQPGAAGDNRGLNQRTATEDVVEND